LDRLVVSPAATKKKAAAKKKPATKNKPATKEKPATTALPDEKVIALARRLGSGAGAAAIVGGDWNAQEDDDSRWDVCGYAWENEQGAIKRKLPRGADLDPYFAAFTLGFEQEIERWMKSGVVDYEWVWSEPG
jgi:hypothetical protein